MAPSTEPRVADRTTPDIVRWEVVVMNPPKGRITSDGMGGNTFSSASSKKMPIYPNCSMKSVIHVFIKFLQIQDFFHYTVA
ncbi:hypothetical protein D3C72_2470280 [compost metagenome]